jgi:hypothetical protein
MSIVASIFEMMLEGNHEVTRLARSASSASCSTLAITMAAVKVSSFSELTFVSTIVTSFAVGLFMESCEWLMSGTTRLLTISATIPVSGGVPDASPRHHHDLREETIQDISINKNISSSTHHELEHQNLRR